MASAAYRAGEALAESSTGLLHDFTRKTGVIRSGLVGWTGSREELWNEAEGAERRRDAVVARELQLAVPHELPESLRWPLGEAVAHWLRDRYQVAVDIALHAAPRKGDDRNVHLHLMFTTREVCPEGRFGRKTRVLDAMATGPGEVEAIREFWAEACNAALASAGAPAAPVDHRSYERRGLDRLSTHVGRGAHALEARGEQTEQGDRARHNGHRNMKRRWTPARKRVLFPKGRHPRGEAPDERTPRLP